MSIIYCEKCDKYIDTDYDVEHEEECEECEEHEEKHCITCATQPPKELVEKMTKELLK